MITKINDLRSVSVCSSQLFNLDLLPDNPRIGLHRALQLTMFVSQDAIMGFNVEVLFAFHKIPNHLYDYSSPEIRVPRRSSWESNPEISGFSIHSATEAEFG